MHSPRQANSTRGFTLIELIVVIISIGVLAAIAVPRYVALGTDARIAAIHTMASTLRSTTANVRAMCTLDPNCSYSSPYQTVTVAGRSAAVNFGWLDAGDNIGINQIDAWINYAGFTAAVVYPSATVFKLDSAPDPLACSVTYGDAYWSGTTNYTITLATSGC